MATYIGTDWHKVHIDGEPFDPAPSQAVRNHSPGGFSWGYDGSGPAQLALAILMRERGEEYAQEHYQRFKREVLGRFRTREGPTIGFRMTSEEIEAWCDGKTLAMGAVAGTVIADPPEEG